MNITEQIFKEKSLSKHAELLDSIQHVFRITTNDSDEIRLAIGAIRFHFPDLEKILIPADYSISSSTNTGNDYSNCEFLGNVDFKASEFIQPAIFNETIFHKSANFSKVTFKENVRFHKAQFIGKAQFTNTTFKKLVDFYFSEFHSDQQFHLTDFEGTTIFSNTTFRKSIQFLHNKVEPNSYISFENAIFHNGLDISRSNFWCTIQFWGIDFSKTQIEKLHESELYQNDHFTGLERQNGERALSRIRETFRVIKYEFRKQGNNINAQFFHRLEMKVYSVELKADSGRLGEKMLLLMNGLSNKHGQSWPRAFWFTMIVTGISYFVYLLTIQDGITIARSAEDVGYTIKYFFQLLNLTNWDYKPFGVPNNPEGYIILFICRLFIGYGYYQFIQSFRKYGKN